MNSIIISFCNFEKQFKSYDEKTAGKHYADEFKSSHYFAAVDKCTLFHFAVDNRETGAFTL